MQGGDGAEGRRLEGETGGGNVAAVELYCRENSPEDDAVPRMTPRVAIDRVNISRRRRGA